MTIRHLAQISIIAALVAVPAPAHSQIARERLEVDLGSGVISGTLPFDVPFALTGAAGKSLLKVRLWYAQNPSKGDSIQRSCIFLRDSLKSVPSKPDTTKKDSTAKPHEGSKPSQTLAELKVVPVVEWARANLDSVNNFTLPVKPIDPNKDYTFCFQLVRKPSDDDAARFTRTLSEQVTVALWDSLFRKRPSEIRVDSLQKLLIKSLPKADSIDFGDGPSLFTRLKDMTPENRAATFDRLVVFFAGIDQLANERSEILRDESVGVERTSKSLQLFASQRDAFLKLSLIASAIPGSANDKTRYSVAAAAVGRLSHIPSSQAGQIARGLQPVGAPLGAILTLDLGRVRTSEALNPLAENVAQSIAVLNDALVLLDVLSVTKPLQQEIQTDAATIAELIKITISGRDHLIIQLNTFRNLAERLDLTNQNIAELVASVRTIDFARIQLAATTAGTYQARAKMHIGLDAGLVTARHVRAIVPYLGVNIYFRPVNKNAALSSFPFRHSLRRRFALFAGLSVSSIAESNRIADLFSGHSALFGGGLRVTDYWRVSLGGMAFKSYEGPRDNRTQTLNVQPAVATSVDIDVVSLLGKFGTFLFPN